MFLDLSRLYFLNALQQKVDSYLKALQMPLFFFHHFAFITEGQVSYTAIAFSNVQWMFDFRLAHSKVNKHAVVSLSSQQLF